MLFFRFALQPFRMVSTTSLVVRAHTRLKSRRESSQEEAFVFDPRSEPGVSSSSLTPRLASAIRDCLPPELCFADWHLSFQRSVHGVSMETFYRRQAGPNIIVARDSEGGLFGAFAPEAWRCRKGPSFRRCS